MKSNIRQNSSPAVEGWKQRVQAEHAAIKSDLPFLRDKAEMYRLTLEIRRLEKKLAPWWKVILEARKHRRAAKRQLKQFEKQQKNA